MALGLRELTLSGSVGANSVERVSNDKIKFGPVGIVAIYPKTSVAIPYKLIIGNQVVMEGTTTTTAWDRDNNKLTPVNLLAEPGEVVEFELDNSANGSVTTYEITVFYVR